MPLLEILTGKRYGTALGATKVEALEAAEEMKRRLKEAPEGSPPPVRKPTPEEIVAELERELRMRAQVFPGLVRRGQLSAENAGHRTACLEEALAHCRRTLPIAEQVDLFAGGET